MMAKTTNSLLTRALIDGPGFGLCTGCIALRQAYTSDRVRVYAGLADIILNNHLWPWSKRRQFGRRPVVLRLQAGLSGLVHKVIHSCC